MIGTTRKKRPMMPGRKVSGKNAATVVAVAAITGTITWSTPRIAAVRRDKPVSCCRRKLFSTITIAWSTISPRTSTSANSVLPLSVSPARLSAIKLTANVSGMPRAVISALRTPMNSSKITTSNTRPKSAFQTSTFRLSRIWIEESLMKSSAIPPGIVRANRALLSRTASITPIELPPGTLATRSVIAGRPLNRDDVPFASKPCSTCATSPIRTTPSATRRSTTFSKSTLPLTWPTVRTKNSRSPVRSVPPGTVMFWARTAPTTSSIETPSASIRSRSNSIEIRRSRAPTSVTEARSGMLVNRPSSVSAARNNCPYGTDPLNTTSTTGRKSLLEKSSIVAWSVPSGSSRLVKRLRTSCNSVANSSSSMP